MEEKVKELLLDSGLFELPEGDGYLEEPLEPFGLDSLVIVLFISKAEKEFSIKIDTQSFNIENFKNLKSIVAYLNKLKD